MNKRSPEAYLEPCQTSMTKFFFKNNQRLLAIKYFRKKASSQMFDRFPNMPLGSMAPIVILFSHKRFIFLVNTYSFSQHLDRICIKQKITLKRCVLGQKIVSDKFTKLSIVPVRIYLLKVNNRNTRTRCEIRSKLTIKTPE